MESELTRSWRLLPSERVLWHGGPQPGVARSLRWRLPPLLFAVLAADSALFAGLLLAADVHALRPTLSMAIYLALTAIAFHVAPRFLLDPCEYLVTDRRILWRRGRARRTMDRHAVTLARIAWHASAPGVGDLELERAVPFGPFRRTQRLVLHDVQAPDALSAILRDVAPPERAGDTDVKLVERLDEGEHLLWGGAPERAMPDWREFGTAAAGAALVGVAGWYAWRMATQLLALELVGVQVRSWTWVLFFASTSLAFGTVLCVGGSLLWYGLFRSRAMARDTEYLLTERRLLIRRGRTELSVDRRRIVDVAEEPRANGLYTLYLLLDGPDARALGDSGALGAVTPPKDRVPPILFEVRDPARVRGLILGEPPPPLVEAA